MKKPTHEPGHPHAAPRQPISQGRHSKGTNWQPPVASANKQTTEDRMQGEHGHSAAHAIENMSKPKSNDQHKPAVAAFNDKGMNGEWADGDALPLPDDMPNNAPYSK